MDIREIKDSLAHKAEFLLKLADELSNNTKGKRLSDKERRAVREVQADRCLESVEEALMIWARSGETENSIDHIVDILKFTTTID
jgi:hypothetical protein